MGILLLSLLMVVVLHLGLGVLLEVKSLQSRDEFGGSGP